MSYLVGYGFKAVKAFSGLVGMRAELPKPVCDEDPDSASRSIRVLLESDAPTMIARFGSNELNCVANYLSVKRGIGNWRRYVSGETYPWWWDKRLIGRLHRDAGFFPPTISAVEGFGELMMRDIPLVDLLGSWLPRERLLDRELRDAKKVQLELLNPYFATEPWTRALTGRKVLVVHPFAQTIEAQYPKREQLFANRLLPAFELKVLPAVQSIAGERTTFRTWFDALQSMMDAMDREDYDIALIGCGAYGLPLAAHAKRRGRKGFHLGGSLQLLFGIRGRRWEDPNYNEVYNYARLMNEHWVKPREDERPRNASEVEGACYW